MTIQDAIGLSAGLTLVGLLVVGLVHDVLDYHRRPKGCIGCTMGGGFEKIADCPVHSLPPRRPSEAA